jgi:hypothetical protein
MSRTTRRRWHWSGGALLALGGAVVSFVVTSGAGAAGNATTSTTTTGSTTTTTTTTTSTTTGTPPKNTQPPTLTGKAVEGETLTATDGTWSGDPQSFTYRFLRCDAKGGGCFAGGSTRQKTYTVTSTDVGNTIRVRVTASNSAGSATTTSAPTAVVTKAEASPPAANGCPSGSGPAAVSQISAPARLIVDRQDVSPGVVGRSTQQLQVRFHVSACNRDVQGALVYVTAVPFQQFSIPPETATGADGWATMTMTQLRGFPAATHQQLLVLFVRARKPGENVLGGISTRRLVSFRVDLNR